MRLFVLISLAAMWLAACGGDDPPKFAQVAPDAAREALITREDLPPGWREEGASTIDRVRLSPDCAVLTPEGAFPEATAVASSPSFATVDRRSAQSFSAVFESSAQAAAAVSGLEGIVERCRDEFLTAVRKAAEAEIESAGLNLGPLANIDVSIDKAPLNDAGDQALAYRVKVNVSVLGTEREFNADVAVVRRDQVIGALVYSSYSQIQEEEERAFLALIEERLTAAGERLS